MEPSLTGMFCLLDAKKIFHGFDLTIITAGPQTYEPFGHSFPEIIMHLLPLPIFWITSSAV